MSGPPSELRARILGATRAAPSVTVREMRLRRWWAAAFSVVWLAGWAFAMRAHLPSTGGLALLAIWTLGAVVATRYAFASGSRSVGRPRGVLRAMPSLLGLLVIVGTVVIGATLGHEPLADGHYSACASLSLLIGAGPLAAGFWVERRSDPIAPGSSATALGAIAGAWSGVSMSFVCGRYDTAHTLVAHVGALVILAGVAAVVGRRVLALR